ncbi:MAG: hypothetical protein IIA72_22755 [Proteobacteria bacterium]|nr:hypothetical protein [Pseudomonadota bacterium]
MGQMDQYEAFLRRLESSIKPRQEAAERSRTFTFEFARMALRNMFLLNGGALIALPAFAEMLDGIKPETADAFMWSIGSFVIGLVLIAAATLFAYIAMDADAEGSRHEILWRSIDINADYKPPDDPQKSKDERENAIKSEKKYGTRARKFRAAVIILGLGSLGVFINGAIQGASVLTTMPVQ